MILISANVAETMRRILPIEQNLFPVSFKRKLQYEGYYMREVIDKTKIRLYVEWLIKNNPHFQGYDFDSNLIDDFCEAVRKEADSYSQNSPVISTPVDEVEKDIIEEIPLARQHDTLLADKYEIDTEENT